MITDKEIQRINELYHKSKEGGLTPEELKEQTELRGRYIAAMRQSLRSNLDRIDIKNPDGSVEPLKKKTQAKKYNQ